MKTHNILINILKHQYALYLKTQNYHWNIEGINFLSLHELLENQYKTLAEFIDTTAEHIRSLGVKINVPFDLLLTECKITKGNENFTSDEMLKDLIQSHKIAEGILQLGVIETSKVDDFVISDYLVGCLTFHRKAIWILHSSLPTN